MWNARCMVTRGLGKEDKDDVERAARVRKHANVLTSQLSEPTGVAVADHPTARQDRKADADHER
jgi:hypothetical protein